MRTMTAVQWRHVPDVYKSVIDGQKYILIIDPETGGTVLAPVTVTESRMENP